jgi:hypothetical protein
MWASVIEGVRLNLFCFSFEFSATVMGPLIPELTRIATVARSPPSTFVVVGIVAKWLVGHRGWGVDVLVSHIDVAQ